MKTDQQPKLDDLFNKARNENPVIDIHEVRTMISGKAAATANPNKFSNSIITSKNVFIMGSILVTAATGAWLLFSSPEATVPPASSPVADRPLSETTTVDEPNQTVEPSLPTPSTQPASPESSVLISATPYEPAIIDHMVIPMPKAFKPVALSKSFAPTLVHSKKLSAEAPSHPYLELDDVTLKKLGFLVKDNVLLFEKNNTQAGKLRLHITTESMGVSITSRGLFKKKKQDPVYPLFMCDPSGSSMLRFGRGKIVNNDNYLKTLAPTLIPVIVYPFGKNPEAKHYFEALFWFEPTEDFLNLLPPSIQQQLQENPKAYSVPLPLDEEKDNQLVLSPKKINEDMVIDAYHHGQAVMADKKLLSKLHLKFDKKGAHYKARSKNKSINFNLKNSGYTNTNINGPRLFTLGTPVTKNLLLAWSGAKVGSQQRVDIFHNPKGRDVDTKEYFMNHRREYVAVVADLEALQMDPEFIKNYGSQLVFWFEHTEDLTKLLGEEEQNQLQEYFATLPPLPIALFKKVAPATIESLSVTEVTTIPSIASLELDGKHLRRLGITPESDGILYDLKIETGKIHRLKITKTGIMLFDDKEAEAIAASYKEVPLSGVHPELVTDDLGSFKRLIFEDGSSDKNFDDQNYAATLIPVLVKTGEDYTTTDKVEQNWRPNLIFWYEPTDEFLALLPEREASEIKQELAEIMPPVPAHPPVPPAPPVAVTAVKQEKKEGASCKHFEVCRSIKEGITDYKLFPNPTTDRAQLTLELAAETEVSLYIADVSGQIVKVIKETMPAGHGSIEIVLDELPAGMYLVNVSTGLGDHIFQRLIKAE